MVYILNRALKTSKKRTQLVATRIRKLSTVLVCFGVLRAFKANTTLYKLLIEYYAVNPNFSLKLENPGEFFNDEAVLGCSYKVSVLRHRGVLHVSNPPVNIRQLYGDTNSRVRIS